MKKKYVVIFILLFIFGLLLMFIPSYMNSKSNKEIDNTINNYKNNSVNNSYLLKEAEDYNKKLTKLDIVDSFIDENFKDDKEYNKILNLDDNGMMGYIEIPKIGVKLPIFHTTNKDVMEKGAGHQQGTSFPVGGKGTHSVIAAHRGLPSSKLFTDLNLLKDGDIFYIHVLNKKLAYEVDNIKVVKPTNTKSIKLDKNKDYVTLITCTPYSINTHRLLVRGERVPLTNDNQKIKKTLSMVDLIFYGSITISLILLSVFMFIIIKNNKKKIKKRIKKLKKNTKKKKDNSIKKVNKKVEVLDDKKSEDIDII